MKNPGTPGWFGDFGGSFAPETLLFPLEQLAEAARDAMDDPAFCEELDSLLRNYSGRPTPLTFTPRLSEAAGVKIYLKREDLGHTGAHKINNCLGQALLTRRMGKERIIAETGAGQHGVASATVAARFGLECRIYMGEEDMRRQKLNVYRMRVLGAEVVPVTSGTRTLKDAINEAMREWVRTVQTTHYLLGSVLGPHPFPTLVRDFQSIIGREARSQIQEQEGRLPDLLVACVGGGSNAIGLFHPFLDQADIRLVGVEAGGKGRTAGEHAARMDGGSVGVLHGTRTYVLQDESGNILPTHSVSAGLDYPAVGPEHASLHASGRAEYDRVSDAEAVSAFHRLSSLEGILPALESAHAIAWILREGQRLAAGTLAIVNLSGRGDKDVETVAALDEVSA